MALEYIKPLMYNYSSTIAVYGQLLSYILASEDLAISSPLQNQGFILGEKRAGEVPPPNPKMYCSYMVQSIVIHEASPPRWNS